MQTRSQRTAAAAAQPLPTRPLVFPTEIVCLILASLSSSVELETETDGWDSRNADLARMALVGRQFQESAYSLLYGHMRLGWRSSRGLLLLRSFAANPALHALVRSVDVYRLTEMSFLGEWLHSDEGFHQMAAARLEMLARDPAGAAGGPGGEAFARVAARGVEHVRRLLTERGDHLWLNGVQSYVEGSDLLWHWIAGHSNLAAISIKDFEDPLPASTRLGVVLSRLTRVAVAGALPPELLSHLSAVRGLLLASDPTHDGGPPELDDSEIEMGPSLPHLNVFSSSGWPNAARGVLARGPVALRELQLNLVDEPMMNSIAHLLPTLVQLATLNLSLIPPHTLSPALLSALPTATIERLAINVWPPLELSLHFPPTLRAVVLFARRTPDKPLDFGPFEDALTWKERRAPNLDAVGFAIANLGDEPEGIEQRGRFKEMGKRARGFDLLVTEAPPEPDDEDDDE